MTNVLEDRRDVFFAGLLSNKQILNLSQWTALSIINEMVPRARITVEHSRSLDELCAVLATALALECVMRIAAGLGLELEQFSERLEREVAFNILC